MPGADPSSFASIITTLLAVVVVVAVTPVPGAAGTGSHYDDCGSMFELEGPTLYLEASESTTVTGDSDWGPDAEVSVVLRFGGPSEVVLRNDSVVVDQHGDWEATFDLSGVTADRTFVATVRHRGRIVDAVAGIVGAPSASVTLGDQSARESGEEVTVRAVTMDLGGFVAIHEGEPSGPIVGVSRYLEPGTHTNVTIDIDEFRRLDGSTTLVAMPHKDTDCDQRFGFITLGGDGPYVDAGTAVTDSATVRFPTPTRSPTPTPTSSPSQTPPPSPSPTPTLTPSASPSASDATTPTENPANSTTAPGFDIGAALVAVVGGGLLLRRIH